MNTKWLTHSTLQSDTNFGSFWIWFNAEQLPVNISDDSKVFVRIEKKSDEDEVIRYQYDNHLGSACLELDVDGLIISYEEYHPFGTTSYRSGANEIDVSLKRYKYCGKERDEETGLYYYGMRYYAAWLCRFINVDPLQFKYPYYTPFQYAGNKPITYIDLDGGEPRKDGSIDATFYFRFEPGLNLNIIQKLQYIKQFKRNVRQVWNSYQYNGAQVNVNRVRFEFANGKTEMSLKPYEFIITVGNGTTADPDTISGRSYVRGKTGYMYYNQFAPEAPHEFGHFFGLADRYVDFLVYSKIKGSRNNNNSLQIGRTIPLVLDEVGYNPFTNLYSGSMGGTSITQAQLDIVFNKQIEATYPVPVVLLNENNNVPSLLKVTSTGSGFIVTEFNMENNMPVGTKRNLPWAYQISNFKNHSQGACEPYLNVKAYKSNSGPTIRNNWTLIKERTRF